MYASGRGFGAKGLNSCYPHLVPKLLLWRSEPQFDLLGSHRYSFSFAPCYDPLKLRKFFRFSFYLKPILVKCKTVLDVRPHHLTEIRPRSLFRCSGRHHIKIEAVSQASASFPILRQQASEDLFLYVLFCQHELGSFQAKFPLDFHSMNMLCTYRSPITTVPKTEASCQVLLLDNPLYLNHLRGIAG